MLVIRDFEKTYRKKAVFHGFQAQIPVGVNFIVGPNGVGKSTLFRCLSNVDEKYKGKIVYRDKDIKTQKVGYLPQKFGAVHNLTVLEIFRYVSVLKKAKADEDEIDHLIEKMNLQEFMHTKTQKLSGGTERRLGIGLTLIGKPELIVLDEPSVGLDPKERVRMLEILASLEYHGTILISTHILDDISRIPGANSFMLLPNELKLLDGSKKDELEEQYLYLAEMQDHKV